MTDASRTTYDLETDRSVSALDELCLWESPFGLRLLEVVRMGQGLRVLDVGCGTGFPLLELAARFGPASEIHGLDPWEAGHRRTRLKIEQTGASNVHLHLGRAEQMPFPDHSFDLVVSNNGYNNVADMAQAFRDTARVCRPAAQLVFTLNLDDSFHELHDELRLLLEAEGAPGVLDALRTFIYSRRRPLAEIIGLVKEAGFKVEQVHHDQFAYRFADGTAMYSHPFFRFFQLPRLRELVAAERSDAVFDELERRLNLQAQRIGELRLSVPFVTVNARVA